VSWGAGRQSSKRGGNRLDAADFQRRVQAAKDRHNLSDIIARHTTLKRRGKRELAGLCPFHQERSPSFEVNDNKGTYHCWGCGAGGDAITFLMNKEGMAFRDALTTLDGDAFPVISEEERTKRRDKAAAETAERVAIARSIWESAVPSPGTLAEVYARSRAITMPLPETVRFARTPRRRDPETGEVGRDYPAMVCALQGSTGSLVGVQCVFLRPDGRGKYEHIRDDGTRAKAKLSYGIADGSAFRLGPDDAEEVIVVEGPEDALTLAQELPGRSVWCTCGTELMPKLLFPDRVQSIVLAGDNNAAGRLAVTKASDAFAAAGYSVRAMYPEPRFKDWNDQLRGVAQ
jgi:DNA primase